MQHCLLWVWSRLKADSRLIFLYCTVYFFWGLGMNWFGISMEIAKFGYWWQVFTTYVIYMVPISLVLRHYPFHTQYAYGLVAMGLLEFSGYALNTSYAYPGNIIEKAFGIRNFALAMSLFFALYFPLGNWAVNRLFRILFHPSNDQGVVR